jgi:hypothetical protein
MALRDLDDPTDRVDHPGVGGTRVCHDGDRHDALAHIALERGVQGSKVDPRRLVGRDLDDALAPEAEDGGRAVDGPMGPLGRVDPTPEARRQPILGGVDSRPLEGRLAGRAEGDEVGGRATAREDARDAGREPAQLGEPAEAGLLEGVECVEEIALATGERNGGVGRDRRRRRAGRHEPPPSRRTDPRACEDDLPELVDGRSETDAILGQGAGLGRDRPRDVGGVGVGRVAIQVSPERRHQPGEGALDPREIGVVACVDGCGVLDDHPRMVNDSGRRVQRRGPRFGFWLVAQVP